MKDNLTQMREEVIKLSRVPVSIKEAYKVTRDKKSGKWIIGRS